MRQGRKQRGRLRQFFFFFYAEIREWILYRWGEINTSNVAKTILHTGSKVQQGYDRFNKIEVTICSSAFIGRERETENKKRCAFKKRRTGWEETTRKKTRESECWRGVRTSTSERRRTSISLDRFEATNPEAPTDRNSCTVYIHAKPAPAL